MKQCLTTSGSSGEIHIRYINDQQIGKVYLHYRYEQLREAKKVFNSINNSLVVIL